VSGRLPPPATLHAHTRAAPAAVALALRGDPAGALAPGGLLARLWRALPTTGGASGPSRPWTALVADPAGAVVVAVGIAATIPLPGGLEGAGDEVAAWLAAVPADDRVHHPGTGALAIGALPFVPGEPAELVVPVLTAGADAAGHAWVTWTLPHSIPPPPFDDLDEEHPSAPGPRAGGAPQAVPGVTAVAHRAVAPTLTPVPAEGDFVAAVEAALEAIARGELTKVVLARRIDASFARPIDPVITLRRLSQAEPACTVFAVLDGRRGFLGATPELLVRRIGTRVESHPLAGTALLPGDRLRDAAAARALARSPKDLAEHAAVVSAVRDVLVPRCTALEPTPQPEVVRLRTIAHLGTWLRGTLGAAPATDALSLAAALHPTPAVAGAPTPAALALLARLEPTGRGRYAGPVGWMDARGDGAFFVGIRSAEVAATRASVYAGAGIVAGSDPKEELAETTLKLTTALDALIGSPSAVPLHP